MSPALQVALAALIYSAIFATLVFTAVRFHAQLSRLFSPLIGVNWRTTLSALGAEVFSVLTVLSGLSYSLGPMADIIPPVWKTRVLTVSLVSAFLLRTLNGYLQKDKIVTGGSVAQDADGKLASPQPPVPEPPQAATPL